MGKGSGEGDEDVATPTLERGGDVLIAVRRCFGRGAPDGIGLAWGGAS
jgi:hypothetical protein